MKIGTTLGLLTAAALTASNAPPPAAPRRIVSLDLCADQLVLALADRSQIAGLSRFARDPGLSAAADKVRGLPILRDTGESLLVAHPDMVVAIPARPLPALDPHSYRLVDAPNADNYGMIVAQLRQVGRAVGHADRAEAIVDDMNTRLAALPHRPGRGKIAAYYQRRGYMTGTGTLVDELIGRMGLINLAAKLGKPVLSQLSLEEMVAARPDYLILESATADVRDQGTEMLHHPALRDIPRLWIPQAWTVCGTPDYVRAAESLARQLQSTRH